jgi:hypothetical protein
VLRRRSETLRKDNLAWSQRLNQTGGEQADVVSAGVEQALQASILRGATPTEAANLSTFKERFDDDDAAAEQALRRYQRALQRHTETLRTGDPNVAFSRLLSDVWTDMRIRANRADVELNADQLGFGSISSVNRGTLTGRVLNLALAARICDVAIRHGAVAIENVQVPPNIEPGSPTDFLVLWPIDVVILGDAAALKRVLDLLSDPANPVPLGNTRLAQPRRGAREGSGIAELTVRASSVVVRPTVNLNLDSEEDE